MDLLNDLSSMMIFLAIILKLFVMNKNKIIQIDHYV